MGSLNLPFASIIVPVFNGENTLKDCLDSLMGVDYPPDLREIIVADNNSTDTTPEIIGLYPVRGVQANSGQGPSVARNAGIRVARGQILAFVDVDVVVPRAWLRNLVQGFEGRVGCVGGPYWGRRKDTVVEEFLFDSASGHYSLSRRFLPFIPAGNVAFRKAVFEEIGYFDESLITGEDADLCWRMQLETDFRMRFVPEAFVTHRFASTFSDLFFKLIGYGMAESSLYAKYHWHPRFPKYRFTVKSNMNSYRKIVWELLKFAYRRFLLANVKTMDRMEVYDPLLKALSYSARYLGRLKASRRTGVLYLY